MHLNSILDDVQTFVEEKLAAGRSADEVIWDALRLLRFSEDFLRGHLGEIDRQVAEGIEAEERGDLHDGQAALAKIRPGRDRGAP